MDHKVIAVECQLGGSGASGGGDDHLARTLLGSLNGSAYFSADADDEARDLRSDVMAILMGRGHPMPQVMELALAAVAALESYPNGADRYSFLSMFGRAIEGAFCLEAVQEAKQATDFIISGRATA